MADREDARSVGLGPLKRAPAYAASTWGPYYNALNPPRQVHFMVQWKAVPKWYDRAAEIWRQRQLLRRTYEAVHGEVPDRWPAQHPGVVLGQYAACLRCQWIADGGVPVDGSFEKHWELVRLHESTDGKFRGDNV